jgi:DNA-binding protein HU-beta
LVSEITLLCNILLHSLYPFPYCPYFSKYYNRMVSNRVETLLKMNIGSLLARAINNKNKKMNKQGIVEVVNGVLNTTKVQAEQVVDKVFDSIVDSLKKGEEVSIAGLGIFSVKGRAARDARNPRTGETVKVPAMNVPKFRAAKALKDAVK